MIMALLVLGFSIDVNLILQVLNGTQLSTLLSSSSSPPSSIFFLAPHIGSSICALFVMFSSLGILLDSSRKMHYHDHGYDCLDDDDDDDFVAAMVLQWFL